MRVENNNNRPERNLLDKIKGLKRIIKYTPAVTKVEECTKAETGVGAAIAAGSQAENGIWALLVKAANNPKPTTQNQSKLLPNSPKLKIFHPPQPTIQEIPNNKATSPIRLDSTVIIPAL